MLSLDKAWSLLQALTAPEGSGEEPRPAFRMFEGRVTDTYTGWLSWVRTLTPGEVAAVARDLESIDDAEAEARFRKSARWGDPDAEAAYGLQYLRAARAFVAGLAASGRGMAYMIG